MKVGVLTWYKAYNHGAVLQTYASCKVLENKECMPVVLNYDWQLDIEKKENAFTVFLNRMKKFTPQKFFWYLKVKKNLTQKIKVFEEFVKSDLPIGDYYDCEPDLDAVYIGSDMVFDITEGYNPYMYGVGVKTDYIFSYAASFGYTTIDKLATHPNKSIIYEAIRNLKSIGYRDQNTKNICDKIAPDVMKTENIDPALCYGFEKEIELWDTKKWANENYILIYAYDSTMNDKETVSQVKEYARKNGLKIISCGYYHKWCDEIVCASPKEFVEMIKHANCVLTDTFHGTVFALLMHKNFASIIRKNGFKLKYLLECCGMSSRIVNDRVDSVLDAVPMYDCFDEWLKKEQSKSRQYIQNNLDMCVGEK